MTKGIVERIIQYFSNIKANAIFTKSNFYSLLWWFGNVSFIYKNMKQKINSFKEAVHKIVVEVNTSAATAT